MKIFFDKPVPAGSVEVEYDPALQAYKVKDFTIPDRVAQAIAIAVARHRNWKLFTEPVECIKLDSPSLYL
jgi:hypothetical protein